MIVVGVVLVFIVLLVLVDIVFLILVHFARWVEGHPEWDETPDALDRIAKDTADCPFCRERANANLLADTDRIRS